MDATCSPKVNFSQAKIFKIFVEPCIVLPQFSFGDRSPGFDSWDILAFSHYWHPVCEATAFFERYFYALFRFNKVFKISRVRIWKKLQLCTSVGWAWLKLHESFSNMNIFFASDIILQCWKFFRDNLLVTLSNVAKKLCGLFWNKISNYFKKSGFGFNI